MSSLESQAGDGTPVPDCWFAFRVLSLSPLVTISTVDTSSVHLLELAMRVPELFDTGKGLHLLHPTWNYERSGISGIALDLERTRALLPGHEFLYLANYDHEANLVSKAGLSAITTNDGVFADEKVWRPYLPRFEGFQHYDAVYDARIETVKRHRLATSVKRPLLIYGHSVNGDTEADMKAVQAILPQATFANHRIGRSRYLSLDHDAVVRLYGHASVGLALSAEEGAMRASTQYLLAGLPVVSTHSVGGRDRYYHFPFTRIVSDDPDEIASTVSGLAAAGLDRGRIRQSFQQILDFERHNVVIALNHAVAALLGTKDFLRDFTPLIGSMSLFRHLKLNMVLARQALAKGTV